jgi:hypothetical protein
MSSVGESVLVEYSVGYYYGSYLSIINGCEEFKTIVVKFKDMETYKTQAENNGSFCAWITKLLPDGAQLWSGLASKVLDNGDTVTNYVVFPDM